MTVGAPQWSEEPDDLDQGVLSDDADPIIASSVREAARSFDDRQRYFDFLSRPPAGVSQTFEDQRRALMEEQDLKRLKLSFRIVRAQYTKTVAQVRVQVILMWVSVLMVLTADAASIVMVCQHLSALPTAGRVAVGCVVAGSGTAGASAIAGRAAQKGRSATAKLRRPGRPGGDDGARGPVA